MIFNYDGTREKCPVPLVAMRLLLRKMFPGDRCVLLLKDAGSRQDIPKLLNKIGYCYRQYDVGEGIIKIIIENKLSEDPPSLTLN